jgi:hypothetical protein
LLQDLHPATAADAASESDRLAYNAAFQELDLNWYWDAATYARVQRFGRSGLRSWLETEYAHLLRAYTTDFLVDLIETTKARHMAMARATRPPRSTAPACTADRLAA